MACQQWTPTPVDIMIHPIWNLHLFFLLRPVFLPILSWFSSDFKQPSVQDNHASLMAVVTPTDRSKSVRNHRVLEHFGGVFVLSLSSFFQFSVVEGSLSWEWKSLHFSFLFTLRILDHLGWDLPFDLSLFSYS